MKYLRHHTLLFLSLSVFSCLSPVTDSDVLNSNPQLVVNSRFSDGEPFEVQVKKILPYNLSAGEEFVRDAQVDIYGDDELIQRLTFFDYNEKELGSEPCYTSDQLVAQYGINYKVEVNAPGLGRATSTGQVPRPSDVSGTYLQEGDGGSSSQTGKMVLSLEITDNEPNVRNFFFLQLWQLYKKTEKINDVVHLQSAISKNSLKMGQIQPNDDLEFFIGDRGVMFSDDDFGADNKRTYAFKVELDFIPKNENEKFGDLILHLNTIDQPGYSFLVQATRQNTGQGGAIAHSVIDFSNITGGSGIFTGSSVSKDTLFIKF